MFLDNIHKEIYDKYNDLLHEEFPKKNKEGKHCLDNNHFSETKIIFE